MGNIKIIITTINSKLLLVLEGGNEPIGCFGIILSQKMETKNLHSNGIIIAWADVVYHNNITLSYQLTRFPAY